jgi:hypothetical protein
MDDYIGLAIPTSQAQLRHAANAVMNGIHDVFPSTPDNNNDPISFKKLQKHDGTWTLRKDILGFTFDGVSKTLWLEAPKRNALLTILHQWLQASWATNAGIPFQDFESITAKLRHAFTAIPAGKGLLSTHHSSSSTATSLFKQPSPMLGHSCGNPQLHLHNARSW